MDPTLKFWETSRTIIGNTRKQVCNFRHKKLKMSLQKCFPKNDPTHTQLLTHNLIESFDIYSCSLVPVYYSMIQGSERVLYSSSQPSPSCLFWRCICGFVWPVPLPQQQHQYFSGECFKSHPGWILKAAPGVPAHDEGVWSGVRLPPSMAARLSLLYDCSCLRLWLHASVWLGAGQRRVE